LHRVLADCLDEPARFGRVLKLVNGAVEIDLAVVPELRPRVAAQAKDLDRIDADILGSDERLADGRGDDGDDDFMPMRSA